MSSLSIHHQRKSWQGELKDLFQSLFCSPSLRKPRAGAQGETLKAETMEEAAYRLAQPAFLYNPRLQAQGGVLHGEQGLNTSIINQKMSPQACLQVNLVEKIPRLRFCPLSQVALVGVPLTKNYAAHLLCARRFWKDSHLLSHIQHSRSLVLQVTAVSQLLLRRTSQKQGGVRKPRVSYQS